jgi:hypothetical protein
MTPCDCTPGTHDNGWMEERCASCRELEMRSWAGLQEFARRFAREMNRGSA